MPMEPNIRPGTMDSVSTIVVSERRQVVVAQQMGAMSVPYNMYMVAGHVAQPPQAMPVMRPMFPPQMHYTTWMHSSTMSHPQAMAHPQVIAHAQAMPQQRVPVWPGYRFPAQIAAYPPHALMPRHGTVQYPLHEGTSSPEQGDGASFNTASRVSSSSRPATGATIDRVVNTHEHSPPPSSSLVDLEANESLPADEDMNRGPGQAQGFQNGLMVRRLSALSSGSSSVSTSSAPTQELCCNGKTDSRLSSEHAAGPGVPSVAYKKGASQTPTKASAAKAKKSPRLKQSVKKVKDVKKSTSSGGPQQKVQRGPQRGPQRASKEIAAIKTSPSTSAISAARRKALALTKKHKRLRSSKSKNGAAAIVSGKRTRFPTEKKEAADMAKMIKEATRGGEVKKPRKATLRDVPSVNASGRKSHVTKEAAVAKKGPPDTGQTVKVVKGIKQALRVQSLAGSNKKHPRYTKVPSPPAASVAERLHSEPVTKPVAREEVIGGDCPILGCHGLGHIRVGFATHRSASGCPLAKGFSTITQSEINRTFDHMAEIERLRAAIVEEERVISMLKPFAAALRPISERLGSLAEKGCSSPGGGSISLSQSHQELVCEPPYA